jgi:hypothetical protein
MLIRLHKNATTTPAIRAYIRNCGKPIKVLARELNLNVATVRKWRQREEVHDVSHRPYSLQTTLSRTQETLVVELRRTLLLSLDDLTAITRAHIHPEASRAAIGRLLKREGLSRLADLIPVAEGETTPSKVFKDYAPGYVHIDLKELPRMPDETDKSYLCVAIDRASRWVYFEVLPDKTAQGTRAFLDRLVTVCPFKIERILTDNGKEFTDRFTAQGEREPTGRHHFDQACAAHHIEHRLIPPGRPQTNGMVERFNGRIAELLRSTRSTAPLNSTWPSGTIWPSTMASSRSAHSATFVPFKLSSNGNKKTPLDLFVRYVILRDLILRYMPEENERVLWTRREAVNSWLESDGAHYRLIADDKEPDKSNTDSAWCTSKTLTKGEKQRIAILEAIRNKGYDPMNIPDGGKSVLRGICEHDYPEIFDADTSFDSCWRQGTGTVWEMTNHASYSKRGK